MIRDKWVGIAVAVLCAFVASSLWYSPLLFGTQFLKLSGMGATTGPAGLKIAAELVRDVLLASAISWLLSRHRSRDGRAVLAFVAVLWFGFPFVLLSGSVMWQNVPPELALIHSGDWLMKIGFMTVVPWLMSRGNALRSREPGQVAADPAHTF